MIYTEGRPKIAIIDPNTLATMGLKQMLLNVMPIMSVDTYGSFMELEANQPDQYFHYFVSMAIVLENKPFFLERRRKTIVLTLSLDSMSQLSEFHSLCINVPEQELVRSLLMLEQHAHGQGQNMPPMPSVLTQKILSDREIEVMSLIVQGFINKEIAEKLNITPQEHRGQTGNEECLRLDHLCRDAWLCRYQQDIRNPAVWRDSL